MSQYQKGKTNLDFTEATDNEWQWHQLGHMQVCTSLQTDNHAITPPLSFLQALPAAQPNSIKGTLVTFARSLINAPQGSLQHTPCCQQRVRGHSKDRRLQWQSGD